MTLVEQSIVGGAAHLWDCIPSKTMAAASIRIDSIRNAARLGLLTEPGVVHLSTMAERISTISTDLKDKVTSLLRSQEVEIIQGRGRFTGPHQAVVETEEGEERTVRFDLRPRLHRVGAPGSRVGRG